MKSHPRWSGTFLLLALGTSCALTPPRGPASDPIPTFAWVTVPAGTFTMGSPVTEPNRSPGETPHAVTLTTAFELTATAVTQSQWYQVMGNNPSVISLEKYCPGQFQSKADGMSLCPAFPVENVSRNDAFEFIGKLNAAKDGHVYRLPTEAEWEYAARAGTQTAYYFGQDPDDLGKNAWYVYNSDGRTHPVGSKGKNGLGLYDMAGLVLQWTQDCFGAYPVSPQTNPLVDSANCQNAVIRGGSWWSPPAGCRSAARLGVTPTLTSKDVGFRLARTP